MPGRKSKTRLSKSEAREAFVEEAGRLWDRFTAWYGAHPEATFDDIDREAGEEGRAHLGMMVELMLRGGELGAKAEAPKCERCGKEMVFKGYPEKGVEGLKVGVELRRAYYVCPDCGLGFFPPGSDLEAAPGQLE
jgi:hypothetical protein